MPAISGAKKDRFLAVFPRIEAELLEHLQTHHLPGDAKAWYKRNLEYNVPGGKLNRGISVVDTVEIMRGAPLSDEEYFEVALLGWGIELLQSFFLVSDDIMDTSITRRDQPCWYRVEKPDKVGLIAINDAFMLEGAIYFLLKKHFKGRPYYSDLVDLFHDMTYATELGQLIDLITAPEDTVELSRFSLTKHRLIVLYKTAYYSFYLPVALAMIYTGIPVPATLPSVARTIAVDPTATVSFAPTDEPYQLAMDILLPLGEYFQVQDDYLDCFGQDIGKIGTDILDNKCSWVVCTALQLASPSQRAMLDANYGRKSTDCEKACKTVFEELGLRAHYVRYEEDAYARINKLIDSIDEKVYGGSAGRVVLRRDIFRSFVSKIYRRQK
ncbi:farnesyl-diphosphate synthase [Ramaria rubella]|nr:farnesyl-diphosphate synthase [Ramaria rubella]